MTYPNTPEEKARHLGARLACEAFNACGSLDAKKCQEVGDAFGKAIAELVRPAPKRLPPDEAMGPFPCFMGCGADVPEPMVCDACYKVGQNEPEPSYMHCFVCGKHRGDTCGHDTGNGAERRWYCSKECGDR